MKKIINSFVNITAVSLLVMGCSEFLNKQPTGVVSSEIFFTNADQAVSATTAIYDITAWYSSQQIGEWALGDLCSDDAEKGGEGPADAVEMQHLKNFNADAENQFTRDLWEHSYQGIYRANIVIENVPSITMDNKLRTRLVAEAKFLRALIYFRLVRAFGGVPLVLHSLNRSEYCKPRATIEASWNQIETDLKDAAGVLPEKSEYDDSDMGRATKGAANALLTKAYIFQKKWSEALAMAEIVMGSEEYDLEENYEDIYTLAHENGDESIYEFQHMYINTGKWGDDNEGQVTAIMQGSRDKVYFQGWGFDCPTQDFVDAFEEGDPRLAATVIKEGDTLYKGTDAEEIATNPKSPTRMHNRKYLLEYMDPPPSASNAPANWRFIRYADLLLWHAEAANELGESDKALESLNKIRARVDMPAVTETNQDSLREIIFHERRVELGLEGHRYFDIIRTGRGEKLLGKNGFVAGKHEYFPIPQSQLDVCDNIEQNPYY